MNLNLLIHKIVMVKVSGVLETIFLVGDKVRQNGMVEMEHVYY